MLQISRHRVLQLVVILATSLLWSGSSDAQLLKRPLLPRRQPQQQGQTAAAFLGQPFGVGYASFELPGDTDLSIFQNRELVLTEKRGRAYYMTYDSQPVRTALRNLLGLQTTLLGNPIKVKVYFLFVGVEPLELTLHADRPHAIAITPVDDRAAFQPALAEWWDNYTKWSRKLFQNDEYPLVADQYLHLMLGRRLGLQAPKEPMWSSLLANGGGLNKALGTILGAESVRLALQKDRWLREAQAGQVADRPLPVAVQPPPVVYEQIDPNVAIEPIARAVPHEFMYVRFGSFSNFQWFTDTMEEWGGDLRNLIAFRGVDYEIHARQQRQLALKQSALGRVLGPTVIADVALIGMDTFMREGAAMGMLFQAKSNFALASDINNQRTTAQKANPDATLETVDIAGQKVSYLHTPDNRLRSFYVASGDFHFVTTSRRMVERFLEIAKANGAGSLGDSPEFRSARTQMPVTRPDTVFAYLSDAYFRNLSSPQYRIEMTRRMQALNEIDEWQLAQWTAKHEGITDLGLENLIKFGYLPPTFNQHADGGRLIFPENGGRPSDALRGGKGTFTPIPDMPITSVTSSEEAAYAEFAGEYSKMFKRMDPVMAGVQRFAVPAEQSNGEIRERVLIDLKVAPVANRGNDLQKYLAPPTLDAAQPLPEDALLLQISSWSELGLLGQPAQQIPNNYALGVRNAGFNWQFQPQFNAPMPAQLTDAKLYLAAWPQPGMLRMLGAREVAPLNGPIGPQPLQNGMLGVPPLWQQNRASLSAISWDQATLQDVAQRFPLGQSERPANVRLFISDLNSSKLRDYVNGMGYYRARQVSAGNIHFLQNLIYQIGVPAENAKALGEDLLMGKFLDPLGGQYEVVVAPSGLPQWRSTAWTDATERLRGSVPPEFLTPPLDWFRGMSAEAALYPNEYIGRVEIEMKRNPVAVAEEKAMVDKDKPALPFFSLPKFLQQDPPAGNGAPVPAPPTVPLPASKDPMLVPPTVPASPPAAPNAVPPSVMKPPATTLPNGTPTIPMPPPPSPIPATKSPENVPPPPVPNLPVK
jgi:hypothetical protein